MKNLKEYIKECRKKQLAVLVDPDKCDDMSLQMLAINAEKNKIDYIFVGGSIVFSSIDHTVQVIKKNCNIPVLIFPGNVMQISEHADGILFLSLISGRNPEFLIGHHVIAAPALKASGLEVIPTGYILIGQDTAGFIVNRINGMAFLEALRLLDRGVATAEDIDKAMRLGLGHPMGPFELMDMVGLDVVLNARMGVYNETRDPNHFPPAVLQRMVEAGRLGRKTNRGFYEYPRG